MVCYKMLKITITRVRFQYIGAPDMTCRRELVL